MLEALVWHVRARCALAMAFSTAAVATFVAVVGGFGSFGGWYAGRQSQVEDPVLPAPEPGSLACPEQAQCECPELEVPQCEPCPAAECAAEVGAPSPELATPPAACPPVAVVLASGLLGGALVGGASVGCCGVATWLWTRGPVVAPAAKVAAPPLSAFDRLASSPKKSGAAATTPGPLAHLAVDALGLK